MDPWDHIRRASTDRRSGSADIARRAAQGLAELSTKRDVIRAARHLLRAHPPMAALWRLVVDCYDAADPGDAAATFVDELDQGSEAAVDAVRWIVTRRRVVVITYSASGTVADALLRVRGRVDRVVCPVSLPGGEGRTFARRLERDGFDVDIVADAAVARACAEADLALVGADAVTPQGVVNKVGTRLLALAAYDAGIGCYAIAPSVKMLPQLLWRDEDAPAYEVTPLRLFDAVVTERGARSAGPIKRWAARFEVPDAIARIGGR